MQHSLISSIVMVFDQATSSSKHLWFCTVFQLLLLHIPRTRGDADAVDAAAVQQPGVGGWGGEAGRVFALLAHPRSSSGSSGGHWGQTQPWRAGQGHRDGWTQARLECWPTGGVREAHGKVQA